MTIADINNWRAAQLIIKRYGREGAPIEAAARADDFLAQDALAGQRTGVRIAAAIDELLERDSEGS